MTTSPTDGAARGGRMARAWIVSAALLSFALPATAQEAGEPVASTPLKTTPVADLTHRYRFSEQYARSNDDRDTPSRIAAYRVGIVEVVKDAIDVPKGAPHRTETTRRVVFVERPTEFSALGVPGASVRFFEQFQARPLDGPEAVSPRPFEGLAVYCRPRPGEATQLLSLTEGRRLRDFEYEVAAREAFLPQVAQILPAQAMRVGDSWHIPRRAAQALIGEPNGPVDALTGKLVELRREVDGPRLVAVIGISGKVEGQDDPNGGQCRGPVHRPPRSGGPGHDRATRHGPARRPRDDRRPGRPLTEIRLARETIGLLPGPGRLRYKTAREVVVHRQLAIGPDATSPLPRTPAPPAPTDSNSWLTYLDPKGRFAFDHPQDLLAPDPYQLVAGGIIADPDTATMTRARRDGHDLLQVEFVDKTVGPEILREKMAAKWGGGRIEVMKGGEEWLPEADWPRMKVHRIEAAIKAPERPSGGPRPPHPLRRILDPLRPIRHDPGRGHDLARRRGRLPPRGRATPQNPPDPPGPPGRRLTGMSQ